MPLTRINPMTNGLLTLTVVDDTGAAVTDATVRADIYGPTGTLIQNDALFTHFQDGIYTLEIAPEWSTGETTDAGPQPVEGRYRAIVTTATPDSLQEVERISWVCAFAPEE